MNSQLSRKIKDVFEAHPNWLPSVHDFDRLRAESSAVIEISRKLRAEHPEDIGSNYDARMEIRWLEELINRILWRMHHPLVTVFPKRAKDEAPKA